MPAPLVRVTYFVEIVSSWCHWVEPTWSALQDRFIADEVAFDWKIALMPPAAFPADAAGCDRAYQRSGTIMQSPYRLKSGWFEAARQGDYRAPNLVAEAGRDFDCNDDRLRLALSEAALLDGRRIGRMEEAVKVGAEVLGVEPAVLTEAARSDAVAQRVEASTALFHAHQIDQRPAFILESSIGDKTLFSGVVREEPLAATIEAMLADARAYASFRAHFGEV